MYNLQKNLNMYVAIMLFGNPQFLWNLPMRHNEMHRPPLSRQKAADIPSVSDSSPHLDFPFCLTHTQQSTHCILMWSSPRGRWGGLERTDNDPHVSYSAGATGSLFLPQFYSNYSDAQFKMITPITEGNARGMCPIDNKGSSVSYASGGRNSSLNGGWMVGLRHYYLKHILPKTSHSAIHHGNCIIKGKRRSKGFLELKYSIPPILFYIFYL